MKSFVISFGIILLFSTNSFCQSNQSEKDTTKLNDKINFVLGIGARSSVNTLYQDPSINLSNNFVSIDKASNLSSNVSFGIVYTPWVYKITDLEGEYFANKGLSFSTFVSPITLVNSSTSNGNAFFENIDFGVGIGYKAVSGFMFMITVEFVEIRQPKDWFLTEYGDNNKMYVIDDNIQKSIDVNDTSIFKQQLIPTFGFKMCYTFDIVKSFKKESEIIK